MKKVAGTLKLDQAQYRELAAFAKFGSDLDAATRLTINRGTKNQEVLKQAQYSPFRVGEQVAAIFASSKGYLDNVAVEKVKEFEAEFMQVLNSKHKSAIDDLSTGKFDDSLTDILKEVATEVAKNYQSK
jgi:F-type H+/Na+-transporting ATPase subunit alpha